jgi:hypothetical protein
MKTIYSLLLLAAATGLVPVRAQDNAASDPARQLATNAPAGYASDIVVVSDAQQQALELARQMPAQGPGASSALQSAITEMQRAQVALEEAKKSPEKLSAAILAEQAAYQALLKAMPREFRMTRARQGGQGQGSASGQPDQRQFDQLDAEQPQNRYETERQAESAPNAQQRDQTQIADRLKELAQRQQDLNDRLRELQTALQAARTDQERTDIQDQLKRLDDEQRQMLASVDDLRQQLEQSPNASAESGVRQQLEQTRTDMQRAAEALQNQSASQALAAGTRAQQSMQQLRNDLKQQTSSQFAEQMRQMRNDAREMTERENDIARGLDALNNGAHQSLDDSAQREQISRQMEQQAGALTNLLANMKEVTERAETTEPLLSKQLYDTLRRADQMRTDNLLAMGAQLVDRGFLPQAGEVERSTRTNLTELANRVQRAADSVLGSQADSLRYAQRELDDLKRQLEQEIAGGGGTNAAGQTPAGPGGTRDESNHLAQAAGGSPTENAAGGTGTNGPVGASGNRAGGQPSGQGNPLAGNQPGNQPGMGGERANGQDGHGQPAAKGNPQNGPAPGQGETAAGSQSGQGGRGTGNQPTSTHPSPGPSPGARPSSSGGTAQNGGSAGAGSGAGNEDGGNADRLRQIAEQLGRGNRATGNGGPITGNNYAAWSQQLRDVESVLDSPDLRNQLTTVRDRVGDYRAAYRNGRQIPSSEIVREQLLLPLAQVQVWVSEELARQENGDSLVPLDRDPVPENYSELVRKYYEKLGSAQ